jgi:hypothetical protein
MFEYPGWVITTFPAPALPPILKIPVNEASPPVSIETFGLLTMLDVPASNAYDAEIDAEA